MFICFIDLNFPFSDSKSLEQDSGQGADRDKNEPSTNSSSSKIHTNNVFGGSMRVQPHKKVSFLLNLLENSILKANADANKSDFWIQFQ